MSQLQRPQKSLLLKGFHIEILTLCRGSHPRILPFRAVSANRAPGHEFPFIKEREHLKMKRDGLTTQHFLSSFCEGGFTASFSTLVVCFLCYWSKELALRSGCRWGLHVFIWLLSKKLFFFMTTRVFWTFFKSMTSLLSFSLSLSPQTETVPLDLSPGRHYCLINGFWTLQRQVTADR